MEGSIIIDMNRRMDTVDVAKGVGMVCIIAGHMGVTGINNIVFSFHVPLFFLISGYFLSDKKSNMEYLYKKAQQLLLPYFFTGIVLVFATAVAIPWFETMGLSFPYSVKSMALAVVYGSGSDGNIMPFGIQQVGVIWYLLALMWALCIVKIIGQKPYAVAVIMLLCLCAFWSVKHIWLPLSIQSGCFASAFVYIGYLLKKGNVDLDKPKIEFAFCGVIAFVVFYHYDIHYYLNSGYFSQGLTGPLLSLFIIYLVIYLSQLILRIPIINDCLIYIGKNSLAIMCVHMIEQIFMPWTVFTERYMHISNMVCTYIIVFIFKLFFSILGASVLLDVPFTRKIFCANK